MSLRTGETVSKLNRAVLVVAASFLSAVLSIVPASSQTHPLKTRNVVLIVSDGLRWQEIFSGADRSLMDSDHGGIWADPRD